MGGGVGALSESGQKGAFLAKARKKPAPKAPLAKTRENTGAEGALEENKPKKTRGSAPRSYQHSENNCLRNQLLENDITPSRRERFLREGVFGIQYHDIPGDFNHVLFYFLIFLTTSLYPPACLFLHVFGGLWKVCWPFFVFVALVLALTLTLLLVWLSCLCSHGSVACGMAIHQLFRGKEEE